MKKISTPTTPFQKKSFLVYLAAVSVVFLLMLWTFILPLFLAAIFTGITYPVYQWILKKVRRPVLASTLALCSLVLVLVIPFLAIGAASYQQAVGLVGQFDLNSLGEKLQTFLQSWQNRFPGLLEKVNTAQISKMATDGAQMSAQFILKHTADISFTLVNNLLTFFLMLFMMFYFYIDGPKILAQIIRWSPLKDEYEKIVIQKFLSVSKGTLKGFFAIGIIQGIIGGVLFWAVGLHSPIFLGVLMIFASLIPVLGTALIWGPVAVLFFVQGQWVSALWVVAVGGVVISSVDNFIRPKVVGKDIKMHDLMVLLSTLGGLGMFGLVGFIIGPIIAALFLSVWTIFEEIFRDELIMNQSTSKETRVEVNP